MIRLEIQYTNYPAILEADLLFYMVRTNTPNLKRDLLITALLIDTLLINSNFHNL